MPAINIERAIRKGSGNEKGNSSSIEVINHEGYEPGGMTILLEAITENRNRTAAELRMTVNKHGGNLGENGCLTYPFEHRTEVHLQPPYPIEKQELAEAMLIEAIADLEASSIKVER